MLVINKGKRSFITEHGEIKAGEVVELDAKAGKSLIDAYPSELEEPAKAVKPTMPSKDDGKKEEPAKAGK